MRSLTLLAVMLGLIALVAVPALAQNVRTTAMGETGVGLADDSDATFYNPAGLPWVNTQDAAGYDGAWSGTASAVVAVDADWDRLGISYAGHSADMRQGIGACYSFWDFNGSDVSTLAVGYGMQIGDNPFSAGVAVAFESAASERVFVNFGLMYRNRDETMNEWRAGLLVNDLAEESSPAPIFDLGASVRSPDGLIFAVDINDVSDEIDRWINVGAEFPIPETSAVVRAGLLDGDLTLGAGYRLQTWEFGVAYQDLAGGGETTIGASGAF